MLIVVCVSYPSVVPQAEKENDSLLQAQGKKEEDALAAAIGSFQQDFTTDLQVVKAGGGPYKAGAKLSGCRNSTWRTIQYM